MADVLALAAVVPVLMLAVDKDFLAKSRKLRFIYNQLQVESEGRFLITLIVIVVVFFLIKNIIAILVQKSVNSLCTKLVQNFTETTFYHIINQPFETIVNKGTTDFLNKIHFNSMYFATGVLIPFVNIVGESLVILFILIFIIWFNPAIFFMIILVTAPAFYFINSSIKQKIYLLGEKTKGRREETIESLNIGMNGLVDVKVNHSAGFFIKDFLGKQKFLIDSDLKSIFYQSIPARANEIVVLIGVIILVIYGFFFSENPAGLRALAAVFVLSVFRLVPAINRLLVGVMKLKLHQHTIEFLQHNKLLNKLHHSHQLQFHNEIELKHIFYKFNDAENALLEDVNLKIKKGSVFGITGMSGSGKSTLMKIISGLIQPGSGSISIDGVLLDSNTLIPWQNQIGFVHQSPFIFNKTLFENIALSGTYNEEKMKIAIKASGLENFVSLLPQGLHTLMGEQGSKISEGQKQRIAIARALYKEASVLLFDEATSSLDAATEDIIIESLNNLKKQNVTIIIIAHQKRIIQLCDSTFNIDSHSKKDESR
ncbi:MAG: ABC transporter ATP-binding protein [Bacteroidetes bacterium]|nr:ABC transporter ATP-binding protein [Bacteroidota bacterium]